MEERNNCVYKHTSPSGKVYIGITKHEAAKRWGRGSGYTKNRHLYSAIKKYGWDNFSHEVVAEGLSREEACAKEKELISFYKSDDPDFGYNKTSGGEGNYTVSEGTKALHRKQQKEWLQEHPEHKEKLRTSASQRLKAAWSDKNYRERIVPILKEAHKEVYNRKPELRSHMGRIASERWKNPKYRERFINALCSRTQSERSRRLIGEHQPNALSVICVDTGDTYKTVSEAARSVGVAVTCISDCCKGRLETSAGCRWRYASETEEDWQRRRDAFVSHKKITRGKKVRCVETGQVFQSAQAAAKYINNAEGGTQQSILKCCRGERKSARGYHWKYAD